MKKKSQTTCENKTELFFSGPQIKNLLFLINETEVSIFLYFLQRHILLVEVRFNSTVKTLIH